MNRKVHVAYNFNCRIDKITGSHAYSVQVHDNISERVHDGDTVTTDY